MTVLTSCDVLIAGGGPAGSAAARLLASLGHDVVLATGRRGASALVESLPPSCSKILAATGLLEAVDEAGFVRAGGNTSLWGGELRRSPFQEGTGWQVRRDAFDDCLLEAAAAAGARVLRGATVRAVEIEAGDQLPVRATLSSTEGSHPIRARWILDASGRAGVLAARAGRHHTGIPTLALVRLWRRAAGWGLEDWTHTVVESYEGGWVWSIPVSAEVRCLGAMIDASVAPASSEVAGRQETELARTDSHRRLLDGAEPVDRAWACAATPYASSAYAGPAWALVGDAGSFLDPLTSYGVKKALSSAWLAAVATHTALKRPSMAGPAIELHDAREREAAGFYDRATRRFHEEAAAAHEGTFWRARAACSPAAAGADGSRWGNLASDPSALLAEPAVRTAFEALRGASRISLRQGHGLTRVRRPAVRGVEVVLEERVASSAVPDGLPPVRGVDLSELVAAAAEPADVPELLEAYARRRGTVALPDFLAGVSVLLATGMLENEGAARAGSGAGA